jgi:hypothetical protein
MKMNVESVSVCESVYSYCVLRGTKIFTLYPPSDAAFLKEKPFRKGIHKFTQTSDADIDDDDAAAAAAAAVDSIDGRPMNDSCGKWQVELEVDGVINWIDEEEVSPMASPLVVEVKAGEIFYLPAMWYVWHIHCS